MTSVPALLDLLTEQATDAETTWSLGTFGAIAEFTRDAAERAALDVGDDAIAVVTGRGGLRIEAHDGLRPFASESLTAQSWSQRVALCLPEQACAMNARTVLTEVGPDEWALRAEDRTAVLFDLGLGALQVDACVRSGDSAVTAALRGCVGRSVFELGNGAMGVILAANPHRVFQCRVGRVEVYQPIPPPDGESPEGPHTHVLPKLLRHRRTHAATEPVPAGWIPCAHFYPPHTQRDGRGRRLAFRPGRHAAFQALLARYGDPQLFAIKQRVVEAVVAGRDPPGSMIVADRFARASIRIALRQLQAAEQASQSTSPVLAAWHSAHDRFDPDAADDSVGEHPCTA
jgi:hypothetical protein